ncbi:MAG: class I SAM-dependent methyltransferase [Spirochaetota bacterium]
MIYKAITQCRICGNEALIPVVDLGEQYLTGVFPKQGESVERGPLAIVKCDEQKNGACGLLQLKHNYQLDKLYGQNYGYRSGLNRSMVDHLHAKVKKILSIVPVYPGDLVVDVGSNDSTLLQAYPKGGADLVGVDPTGAKFKDHYPAHIKLIPDFFPSPRFKDAYHGRKAKIITSISMFYDLESPLVFVESIRDNLADDGVWLFEQSYMPTMLDTNSYDTICHEHLEYYALKQIQWMAAKAGMKILDVEFNAVNGGSFSVMAAKKNSPHRENATAIAAVEADEKKRGLSTCTPYDAFCARIVQHREDMRVFLDGVKKSGKKIFGYGASTKGNVMLQYCNINASDLACIAEVNEDKFGTFTPGTAIPIISEKEARAMKPEYFMVLPWHFRDHILAKESAYRAAGGKFVFPLPRIEVV